MHVLSTNIASARTIEVNGKPIATGFFKKPAESITIRKFFVEGDFVGNTAVHGGEAKAVYVYPSEHYKFWRRELPNADLPWGAFGENITSVGLFEKELLVDAVYRFGTALLQVTQPRFPCNTLAAKFGSKDMIERFLSSRRSGSYFTVVHPGTVAPGDSITLARTAESRVSILDLVEQRIAGSTNGGSQDGENT